MINKDSLEKCKQGVKIVDCSRGGIINGADLLDALDSGRVGGAALDVFEKEPPENLALINRQNVICTPHIAGNTDEAQKKIAEDIASKIIAMND
ncbi:unnamed protein product [Soboliphyme baturini]|uniref:2-Hacid_dh_C domain-containing protein n=1 Tax=Soboliphyme baturini TaxID=241478 RepID=A0A183I998_9BILA|nr:unnamed protein product [Soboliphyme baturini]